MLHVGFYTSKTTESDLEKQTNMLAFVFWELNDFSANQRF